MFRKNYIPKGKIYKSAYNGKYFFSDNDSTIEARLVEFNREVAKEEGVNRLQMLCLEEPSYFDTVDDLLEALYEYAWERHKKVIKDDLTYNKGIKV